VVHIHCFSIDVTSFAHQQGAWLLCDASQAGVGLWREKSGRMLQQA
jgi:hypothetical protein